MANEPNCYFVIRIISDLIQCVILVFVFIFIHIKTEPKEINQTILGFAIIICALALISIVIDCVDSDCVRWSYTFCKLIFSFIGWALSLAVIAEINKKVVSPFDYKKDTINVILVFTAELVLNILNLIIDICCSGTIHYSDGGGGYYSSSYSPSPRTNQNNNQGQEVRVVVVSAVVVQRTTTIIRRN